MDERARERAIHDLDTTFLIEASAGTGKTTLAIRRILEAIRTGRATMEQIGAITFTEKAAGELKIRLRSDLERERKQATGEERQRLDEGMRQLERSHIHTIHGFCSWLLKERPIEAGVAPGFQVLDELEVQLLREETWTEWFEQQMELRPEPLKRALFAELDLGRLRQIAFEMVEKRDRIDFDRLIPSTYRVADGITELRAILEKLRPKLPNCIDQADGACEAIQGLLRLSTRLNGMQLYRQEFELLHSVHVKKNTGNKKNWDYSGSLSAIKNTYPDINAIPAKRADALLRDLSAWLKEFAFAYERAKAVRGALDFDDLLLKARDLLLTNHAVRAEFQRRFRFLLVDEFQDTDPVQTEIVFFLAEREARASRWNEVRLQPGKLFLVGDPKQSIYRFRRADIETYQAARKVVEQQGEVLTINQSFRTVSSLIAWVNNTFRQLIQPPADGGTYQPAYVNLHESPDHHTKSPRLCVLGPTPEQKTMLAEDGGLDVVRPMEAREVARLIEHLVRTGEWKIQGRADPQPRGPRYRDFAVLLHSPATSLAAYEEAFQQQGIPYQVEGGKDYFQSAEVRAVCGLLLALDDPMNTRELVGVLRSAVFGLRDEDIYLWSRKNPLNYLAHKPGASPETVRGQGNQEPGVGRALALLRTLHEQRNEHGFAGYLELLYRELKLPELFSLQPHGQQRVANLMKLLAVARRIQNAELLSLREFVSYLKTTALDRSQEGQSPAAEPNDDVVSLLSIHKAKGLEWSVVIVGDLGGKDKAHHPPILCDRDAQTMALRLAEEMRTADYDSTYEQEKLREQAEEIRLLYVAVTRARDYLVLPWFAGKGRHLEHFKRAFDPDHAGEAIAAFFRRDGAQSKIDASPPEPLRVNLGAPDAVDRTQIEQLRGRRVQWMRDREKMLPAVNAGRARSTPSRLADEVEEVKARRREGNTMTAAAAASFGSVMHEVLAMMDFNKPETAGPLWRTYAARSGLSEEDTKRGEDTLQRFTRTDLFTRIAQASEIYRELPFAYRQGENLIEGALDLVFREGTQWFLVDYKTDRIATGEVASHVERYRPQLEAYAESMQTLGGTRPAKILVFLWTGEALEME